MIRSTLHVTKLTPPARRGLVVAEHAAGADVGAAILARGGNAVDAAVATAFAMTVVEPFMSTIAGSGTMIVHLARAGQTIALDFNACAPLRAGEGMYRLSSGISTALFAWPRVEGDANVSGYLAVAVPGSVAGLALALERWGTMELRDVLKPAIDIAERGYEVDWYQALTTAKFIQELSVYPESARTYLREGRFIYRPPSMQPGDRVAFPELARSLTLIAREGPGAFYRGAIAQAIHDDMAAHNGLLTREDLAAYQVRVGEPLWGRYRDLDLAFSPGSTGGITALEILNILGEFPGPQVGWRTVGGLHRRAEAIRRGFRDRFEHLGDPERVKAPWDRLTSREYAREVATELRRSHPANLPRRRQASRVTDDCTTHISVIDRQRNMVALTHTAVSLFGAHVVVPGTGILLNNGMIWFDPEPGKPNSVGPGKRCLVNMVPVLAFRRGEPYLSLGAPGGRAIVSAIPQVLANLVDTRCTAQEAIEAPRVHTEGGELLVSERVGPRALEALTRRGHAISPRRETYSTLNFARPVAIRVTRAGLEAGLEQFAAAAAAGPRIASRSARRGREASL
jgi:gamma-glutamyltranspeptidase / glutathione hydrolase